MNVLMELILMQLLGQKTAGACDKELDELIPSPITTLDGIEQLDDQLQDPAFRKNLVNYLD